MSRTFSIYLDAVRFAAAMLVVLSHFAFNRFTLGDFAPIRALNVGSDAVVVFFVLSGFVIAYATATKERNLNTYLFNRLTRLYSVVVPALVVTALFDTIGSTVAPGAYAGSWFSKLPVAEQAARALSLTNEWGTLSHRIGSNGPLWSLSYEFAYYLLFAAAVFFTGRRRILVLGLLLVLIGPRVLLLMPAWLLGVALYRRIAAGGLDLDVRQALALTMLPALAYGGFVLGNIPDHLLTMTNALFGEAFVHDRLKFSNEFIWNNILGVLVVTHFTGVHGLTRRMPEHVVPLHLEAMIRWLAAASFSIYVIHYPALQLADALLPPMPVQELRHLVLLIVALAPCFLVAWAFERRLRPLRRFILTAFPFLRPQRTS